MHGISSTFELINLETQGPIVVGMNARASTGGNSMEGYLRSTLIDEDGGQWSLKNSDVMGGISKVGVGQNNDPDEIANNLSYRDQVGSNKLNNSSLPFIFGSMTEMSPGQSIAVTMSFVQDGNQNTPDMPPKTVTMATEIVVGTLTSGSKKSYRLYNLTFDRVNLGARTPYIRCVLTDLE